MKKKILFLAMLMCPSVIGMTAPLFAQDGNTENTENTESKTYLPVLEEGKVWIYKTYYVNGPCEEMDDPYFGVKVDRVEKENGRDIYILKSLDTENLYEGRAFEQDGVLWYYSDIVDDYTPMIDFNMEVDYDIKSGGDVIINKEYVDIEGIERLLITIKPSWPTGFNYYWCEGIGAVNDCFLSLVTFAIGERVKMAECWIGDKCIFNEHSLDAFAAVEAIEEVDGSHSPNPAAPMFNVLGSRIDSPAPGQLYIQDGKKHIAR